MHSTILKRVALLIACATILSVASFAQSDLQFENNFFVTGDYVVAGAYGLNLVVASGYTSGLITVPDVNPGITGTKLVPTGAQIVAAFLYWQTVELSTTIPGQAGSGADGFFRPVYLGGPLTPYSITGVNVGSNNTVYWTSSGCTGTKTTEVVRTYRADVRALLPQDANGNVLANGVFQVTLPSKVNSTPFTLGATLVVIYRVLSPNISLNSIVIYDGASSLTTPLTVQGFYDAATQNPVSRLTYIVGSGESTKQETVYLNKDSLPSPYKPLPAFPGFYGQWDNTTWTFPSPYSPNPVGGGSASATTEVTPSSSQQCLSSGAVIVSTTVQNSDNDGLLDAWKEASPPGYCDAAVNGGVCAPGSSSWVDLPGAVHGEQDVFVQLDYMCSSVTGPDSCSTSGDYFDPRLTLDSSSPPVSAAQKVVNAYAARGIHLHINPPGGDNPFYNQNVHAIPEPTCVDNTSTSPPELCPFPNQPGVVGWTGGFVGFKNQLVDTTGSTSVSDCAISSPPADCMPRFQHGRKDSWHYALFAHALALPNWTLAATTLTSVVQSGETVTFTTSTPHMLAANAYDTYCTSYGRVTVAFAITNPDLNGTYCVTVTSATTFTIRVANSTSAAYTSFTDPNLAVVSGVADEISGFSDIGGANSLMALGSWGANGQTWQTQAGTFMHELGHSNGLTHGGYYYDQLSSNPINYTPTIEANCKPNFQSVMSYAFQVDLLDNGGPLNVVDYSGQDLSTLNESIAESDPLTNPAPSYLDTTWYIPWPGVGTPATRRCNGTPVLSTDPKMSQFTGPTSSLSWTADQEINFDGKIETSLRGHDDWTGTATAPGLDLRQVGATGSLTVAGGLQGLGGGGGLQGLGGGGGVGELNQETANSVTRPPRNLSASEGVSPRTIALTWTQPTFGQIVQYNVYQSVNGAAFTEIASVTGTPPVTTYTATVTCNPGGYRYFVTAVINVGTPPVTVLQESVGSNTVSDSGQTGEPLTGCYTNTAPGSVALTNLAFTDLSSPNTPVQGDNIQITWSLNDDDTGAPVTRPAASTALVAIGPIPSDAGCSSLAKPPEYLGYSGTYPYPVTTLSASGSGITLTGNQFAFTWSTTNFNAGCYFFELDLDSHQYEQSTALTLLIFESDTTPHILSTTLPTATAGIPYTNTVQESGGTGALTWSITVGAVPPGTTFNTATGTVSGTPTTAGNYNFTVKVTDSLGNYGTRAFTLKVLIFLSDSAPPTVNLALPNATAGVPYSNTLQTTGGTGTLTWSSTAVPPGLTFSNGTVSGTPTTAGNYNFMVTVTDSASPQNTVTQTFTLTVLIFESDSNAPAVTTNLPAGTVGSPYSNTIDEDGGTAPLTWSIAPGALPPGLSLGPNSGTVSGTPTAPGNYNFTVQVTDSDTPPNVAMLAFMLSVADAQYGDLIVVDGAPNANPLAGTLFRITPTGTSGTIAAISTGQPTGVAVDANTGNIYVSVAAVGQNGTPSVVQVGPSGAINSSFVSGGVLTNPVAVAVDASGNVYVGDNSTNAIYEFNSSGASVGAVPFASLPSSNSVPNHIRMAFDNSGNLDVASDNIGGTAGVVEVDQVPSGGGSPIVLYNTTTKSNSTAYTVTAVNASTANITSFAITSNVVTFLAANNFSAGTMVLINGLSTGTYLDGQVLTVLASGLSSTQFEANFTYSNVASTPDTGTATAQPPAATAAYTGSFSPTIPANALVTIAGFTNAGNNGQFTVVSCTSTTLVVNNANAVVENNSGTATLAIGTVGGIAVLSDGSIDVADYGAQAIYNITNPGAANMAITTAISPLCCNISGMANPPSSAKITSFAISGNVVTFQAVNNFSAGTIVVINGLTTGTYLNGQTLTVIANGLSSTQFEANFTYSNVASTSDLGTATVNPTMTSLYVTLTGANSTTPELQLAVPQTSSVTTVNLTDSLTQASTASGGYTTYTGAFSPTIPVGSLVTITGFTNATNNGTFIVQSCSGTQLVVNNPSGVAETPATAGTAMSVPLTSPNDVAWYSYQAP